MKEEVSLTSFARVNETDISVRSACPVRDNEVGSLTHERGSVVDIIRRASTKQISLCALRALCAINDNPTAVFRHSFYFGCNKNSRKIVA
jgi:hypothetical protein